MGIVIITIPGETKAAFARALHARTSGGVDLVIVQKQRQYNFLERLRRLYSSVGIWSLPKELWYGHLIRLNRRVRETLEYFRATSVPVPDLDNPRTIEVDSVNSDKVHQTINELSPNLLVVWGSTILEPRIVKTARRAINLHMGYCPNYRGALANQHAVLREDHSHIGATIHYVNGKADAGDILEVIAADTSRNPRELLLDINNRAFERYVEIAARLFEGEDIPGERQEHAPSNVLLLKQWLPSLRYRIGKQILEWERAEKRETSWQDAIARETGQVAP